MKVKQSLKISAFIILSSVVLSLTANAQNSTSTETTSSNSNNPALDQLSNQLRSVQHEISEVNGNIDDADKKIQELQTKSISLQSQIMNLEDQIETTEKLIQNTSVQIAKKENQLLLLGKKINEKKKIVEDQKDLLMEYINLLYHEELDIRDTSQKDQAVSVIKLLLTDQSAAEELQQVQYFAVLEKTGRNIYDKLNNLVSDLETSQKNYRDEQVKLKKLESRLNEEKKSLDIQREAKAKLLEETKGEEDTYQQLLEESKKEQLELQRELRDLQDQYQITKSAQSSSSKAASYSADIQAILKGNNKELIEYLSADENFVFKPSWPVEPASGISAFFRDPDYIKVFGVAHNAIDIPTPQGTPIHAPADGIVYKARDNGYGYSYLILLHKGGFMTVYGHVSEFKTKVGDRVNQGDIIALSGATPGTKGAGYMTTGPHLHMEVLKAGKYVDPLNYLPLTALPEAKIPERYKEQYALEKKMVELEGQVEANFVEPDSMLDDSVDESTEQ